MSQNNCPYCKKPILTRVTVHKNLKPETTNEYQYKLKEMGQQRKIILKKYFVDGLRVIDIAKELKRSPQQVQAMVSEIKNAERQAKGAE